MSTATTTAPPLDVQTIMHMVRAIQHSPVAIRKALDKLGFAPAVVINGVAYYSADAADAVFNHFVAVNAVRAAKDADRAPADFRDNIVTKASSPPARAGRGLTHRAGRAD